MMKQEKGESLRQKELAFIGKMLTAYTQKISDHLSVLQVSADRLANLLEQANQGTEEDNRKLADLLSPIGRHLTNVSQKTQHLQRFGQRMGTGLSTFNHVEVIEEAILFSTRLAQVYKASIRLKAEKSLPNLHSNPVCLHFLVSMAINRMLARVGEGGKVLVRTGPSDKGLCITVAGHGTWESVTSSEGEKAEQDWSMGQGLAAGLGGYLEPATPGHDTAQLSIYLPMEGDLKQC